MAQTTQLEYAYRWERTRPDAVWMTQPMGGGEIRTLTYRQALEEARRMAAHLRSLDLPAGSHIALFSKNSAWWILADLAIWMAGHVSVPLFPTLTPDTIRQILDHSESRLIFVGKLDGYAKMAPGIPEDLPRITLPLAPETPDPKWADVIAGCEPIREAVVREPDEVASIIYTSGSTGVPKGVMHSFRGMIGSAERLVEELGVHERDRILSYLPLAHVFERWIVEHGSLVAGFSVFFAESLDTFVADLQRARPTLFISVPRLWQKFQLGVFSKVPEKKLSRLLKIPLLNRLIRKKVLRGLGLDQVRFAGCGSAPIPAELLAWYRSLGLELLEGYGMTENFVYSHVSRPGKVRVGYVGSPYPGVEHRISDDGEIQIKSPGNMLGYYKEPALTAECFTEDGFLKTGDRGEIDAEDRLRITGRVKELFKTSKGKYVAPSPIENLLLTQPDVEQVCVFGSGLAKPFGVCVLSEEARPKASGEAGRAELGERLRAHLDKVNGELNSYEQLGFLVVSSDEWTVDNGLLTPTLKLKRGALEERYNPRIQGWVDQRQTILWE